MGLLHPGDAPHPNSSLADLASSTDPQALLEHRSTGSGSRQALSPRACRARLFVNISSRASAALRIPVLAVPASFLGSLELAVASGDVGVAVGFRVAHAACFACLQSVLHPGLRA